MTGMLTSRLRKLATLATLGGLGGMSLVVLGAGVANAYSPQVQRACKADYNRFCPGYPLHSVPLRQCMESKAMQLSPICVSALIDSGEVERSRLKQQQR